MAASCSICLVNLITPAQLSKQSITISCKHTFHKQCAEYWLSKADSCPECRQKIKIGSVGKPIMVHESDTRLMKMLILIFLLEEIERRYRNKFYYNLSPSFHFNNSDVNTVRVKGHYLHQH